MRRRARVRSGAVPAHIAPRVAHLSRSRRTPGGTVAHLVDGLCRAATGVGAPADSGRSRPTARRSGDAPLAHPSHNHWGVAQGVDGVCRVQFRCAAVRHGVCGRGRGPSHTHRNVAQGDPHGRPAILVV
ncbi:hypothetical protein GCM10023215_57340 [Pseudonocardia yuanmonensis]|uniref:Uncharacterized protein n=1 Tax=Pseudonocardia yuanmonensis TaxID=1095914 RepID=A0ABP8XK42_9PSEU